MRIEQHGSQHDGVAHKYGQDRLFPVHSTLNQARSQHVSQNVYGHRDPEGRVVVRAPCPMCRVDRREIVVVKRTLFDAGIDFDLARERAHVIC